MPLTPAQALALRRHRDLDQVLTPGSARRFVSGYDTAHPFVQWYVNGSERTLVDGEAGRYVFSQDRLALTEAIQAFHRMTDSVDYAADEILVSAGSSPLIVTVLSWMRENRHRELCYFRPLYHTFYFWADLLGLSLRPLADEPLWDDDSCPDLPEDPAVLLITDPVWFAGRFLAPGAVQVLRDWQARTGSLVVVDGTFQYLKWAPFRCEHSAGLLRDRTIRMICPTKSLALHGIRFAYLLGPADILATLRWTCDSLTGSASAIDLRLAGQIMRVLLAENGNRGLIDYIQERYRSLRRDGCIVDPVREPQCGYYVFGKVAGCRSGDLLMDAEYFDLSGHEGCVRVNVLSPDL